MNQKDDLISRQAAIDAVMEFMPSLTTPDGSGQFDREIFEAQEMFVDIGQALNKLPSAQPERRWIPCSERLPDSTEYVLVTDYGETNIGRRFCGRWWLDYCGDKMKDVTAWMPLPEPYERRTDG